MMRDNPVVEIADLNIKAPVLEVTDNKTLSKAAEHFIVADSFIVELNETWVLDNFGDDRITIITCTYDGTKRQIVVGIMKENE